MTQPLRLIFDIHRATHRIGLYIARHMPGITQAEAHILCHLAESGDATIAQLHAAFAHKRSTLTSVLDRMEARRFVTRTTAEMDRRSFVVSLTRSGKASASKIHRILEALERQALEREALESGALRGADRKGLEVFSRVLSSLERAAGQR